MAAKNKSKEIEKIAEEVQEKVEDGVIVEESKVQYFLSETGYPVFFGKELDDIQESAKKLGYPIYFVVGALEFKEEKQGATAHAAPITTLRKLPRIFKVVSNFAGEAIVEMSDVTTLDMPTISPQAKFGLPRLPLELVRKMELFFRTVYKEQKAEAIVILTFDPKHTDSNGWGVLVPKQTNTAGSCKYEPESIVDDKDDDIIILGTAHSHPEMSAYASHTDVGDQAAFDGLHITFGWKGSVTEYHIELQMAGTRFTFTPDIVFEQLPEIPEFDELTDWTAKVSKPTHLGSTGYYDDYPGVGGKSTAAGNYYSGPFGRFAMPTGCPDIEANTILVSLIRDNENTCPVCKNYMSAAEMDRRRCLRCLVFVAKPGENLEKVYEIREAASAPNDEIDILSDPPRPVIWWNRVMSDNYQTTSSVEFLYSPEKAKKAEAPDALSSGATQLGQRGYFTHWDYIQRFLAENVGWCLGCNMLVSGGDGNTCPLCKRPGSIVMIEVETTSSSTSLQDQIVTNVLYEIAVESSGNNLCCELPASECDCNEINPAGITLGSITPEMALGMAFFGNTCSFNPYSPEGSCHQCYHFWELSCFPLRQLTREWSDNPYSTRMNYDSQITGCAFFVDSQLSLQTTLDMNQIAAYKASQRELEAEEIISTLYQGYL